jgi:hypothetical protein
VNLVDDLVYRIRTNSDASILDRMPTGSYIGSRIVPVHDDWLLSGTTALYPAHDQARAYSAAVRRPPSTPHSFTTTRSAWPTHGTLQRAQHAAFVARYANTKPSGTPEATCPPSPSSATGSPPTYEPDTPSSASRAATQAFDRITPRTASATKTTRKRFAHPTFRRRKGVEPEPADQEIDR